MTRDAKAYVEASTALIRLEQSQMRLMEILDVALKDGEYARIHAAERAVEGLLAALREDGEA